MSDSLTTRPAPARSGRSSVGPNRSRAPASDLLRPTARIDQFLLMHSARLDNWREITGLAEKWQAGAAQRADLEAAVAAMEAVEGYHAYPGPKLFALLRERIAANDAGGAARLARRISNALMTRAYRERPSEWDPHAEMDADEVADIMPPGLARSERRRPYCEVLFVSAQPAARWPALADEVRRLRRPEDEFVYEPVFVGSFEDAFCAAAVNPAITSVVVPEGFPFRSRFEAPVLRAVLDTLGVTDDRDTSALRLAGALKRIRPELDIFLLSERNVEDLAGDPAADCVRRVFYAVEEPLELHLSILEGVRDRYETPFFDNLKRYARRPIGTFHALPDRARQVGLQVRLDPRHGRVLRHQPVPRREQRHDRRPRQPSRADRQHQARAGDGGPRLRRRPRLLRHQRHLDLEQDGGPGAPGARRHRPRRPQLPQVAPLRHGAVGRAARLRRGVPDDGILDVRRRAAGDRSSARCWRCAPKAASTG